MKLTIEEELLLHKIQTGDDEALRILVLRLQGEYEAGYAEGHRDGLDDGRMQGRIECRQEALEAIEEL